MSIKYFCDYCKEEITKQKDRVVVQATSMKDDKKQAFHFHNNCWSNYMYAMLADGKSFDKKQLIEETSIQEDIKEQESQTEIEEQEEQEKSVDTVKYREWERSQSKRESKYFTDEVCAKLHRFILLKSKPMAISKQLNIPYQTICLYLKNFNQYKLDNYCSEVDINTLRKCREEYGKIIPKVKTLMATCTWSNTSIAYDCGIPEDVVQLVWDELPWFIKNI